LNGRRPVLVTEAAVVKVMSVLLLEQFSRTDRRMDMRADDMHRRFVTGLSGKLLAAGAAVATLATAGDAGAAIIVSDGFAYGGVAGNLKLVAPAGSTGLTGNWGYSTAGVEYFSYVTAGLQFSTFGGSGGAAQFSQSNFAASRATRQFSAPLGTGTYYMSSLFRVDAAANNGALVSVLLGAANATDGNAPVTVSPDDFGTSLGSSRVAGTQNNNTGTAPTIGTVYLMLNRISLSGANITIDRYILTQAQYDHFQANLGLDASLSQAVPTGTSTGQVLQKGTQSVANTTTSLPYLVLQGYAHGGQATYTIDEFRISDTSFNNLVPEPASATRERLAGGALIGRRRR
jgi:hypothetical protein